MKSIVGIVLVLFFVAVGYAGVRTETAFNSFQVCISADTVGGINKAIVSGEILLDNGSISRRVGYDIFPVLTAGQKSALKQDFLALLRIVSAREDVPTPVPTP